MTTYKLTPNNPDPVTGLQNPLLGWHFTLPTALDVLEGAIFIQTFGWTWDIHPNPDITTQQRMSLTGSPAGQPAHILVLNTQWFALDGGFVKVLEDDDVTNNYTVDAYVPPAEGG